jgi:hypothetical protein
MRLSVHDSDNLHGGISELLMGMIMRRRRRRG